MADHERRLFEIEMEEWRAKREERYELWRSNRESYYELLNAAMSFGSQALRVALLVNGGAAVALLAFVGHVSTKNIYDSVSVAVIETQRTLLESLVVSLELFVFGVGFAAVSTVVAYLCQRLYADECDRNAQLQYEAREKWENDKKEAIKKGVKTPEYIEKKSKVGYLAIFLNWITVAVVICSYVYFFRGIYQAKDAFTLVGSM